MNTEKSDNNSRRILMSVVVPAYNAGGTIDACLNSLLSQTVSRDSYEVIVVDNGSTDETAARIKSCPVTYVYEPNCTVYAARNAGVGVAAGDIIAFTDSDCVADKKWLESGLEHLQQFDIVAGRIKPLLSARKLLYMYEKYVYRKPLEELGRDANIEAGNAFVHRLVFETLGGFVRDITTAGDSIFSIKARQHGYTIGYAASAVVYHPVDGWRRRMRGMMREGYGSKLKVSFREDAKTSFLSKVSSRVANARMLLCQDLDNVRNAWSRNEIDTRVAIGVIGIALFMRIFSYASIVTARAFGGLNRIFARR